MKNKIKNVAGSDSNRGDDPIEKCVICGAETPYKFSTPINQRKYYMDRGRFAKVVITKSILRTIEISYEYFE